MALMTPDMSPNQLTFGRRTQVIEQGLRDTWFWGRRDTIGLDEWERQISDCFPPLPLESGTESALAKALIQRRRGSRSMHCTISCAIWARCAKDGRPW